VVRVPGYRSRGPGFYSRRYQIFWNVVGLERGPLSRMSTTEELLGRNSSGSGLENQEYGHGDPLRWSRDTLYPQKLALTSPTSGGRSVSIVRLRTKATEFFFVWENAVRNIRRMKLAVWGRYKEMAATYIIAGGPDLIHQPTWTFLRRGIWKLYEFSA
jgi:hypothetical protein